jgi:hypothetical protein
VTVLYLPFTVNVTLRARVYCTPAAASRAAARFAHVALLFRPVAGLLHDCMTAGYQDRRSSFPNSVHGVATAHPNPIHNLVFSTLPNSVHLIQLGMAVLYR